MIEKAFDVMSFQAAFFLTALEIGDKLDYAKNLIQKTKNILNGDPMMLPMPGDIKEFPSGLPFIMLKSQDSFYHCNISKDRIDFIFKGKPKEKKNIDDLWPDYQAILKDLSRFVTSGRYQKVWRLGLVATLLKEVNISVNALLLEKYIKPDVFKDAHEIQLNVLNKLSYDGISINRWIKFRPFRKKEDPSKDVGFSVEVDMNTISEQTYEFNKEQIDRFHEFMHLHLISEISKYVLI